MGLEGETGTIALSSSFHTGEVVREVQPRPLADECKTRDAEQTIGINHRRSDGSASLHRTLPGAREMRVPVNLCGIFMVAPILSSSIWRRIRTDIAESDVRGSL